MKRKRKSKRERKIVTQLLKDFYDEKQIAVFCLSSNLEKKCLEFVEKLVVSDRIDYKPLIVKVVNNDRMTSTYFDEQEIKHRMNFDKLEIEVSIDSLYNFFQSYEDSKLNEIYKKVFFIFTSENDISVFEIDSIIKCCLFIADKRSITKKQLLCIKEMKNKKRLRKYSILLMKQ